MVRQDRATCEGRQRMVRPGSNSARFHRQRVDVQRPHTSSRSAGFRTSRSGGAATAARPGARFRLSEEALDEERLECVEVGIGDLPDRRERRATREDASRSKEALLFEPQQVEALGDRVAERALPFGRGRAGLQSAAAAAARALKDLRQREQIDAGSGERERQVRPAPEHPSGLNGKRAALRLLISPLGVRAAVGHGQA
jgi:hypothetical protein